MITHELAKIWITSDGKRFIDQQKATEHEDNIQQHKIIAEKLYLKWEENERHI